MPADPRRWLSRSWITCAICVACSRGPQPPDTSAREPARATTCEPPSPPLAASETYVYAGIAEYSKPEQRAADGTVAPTRRQTRDGNYHVITLQPDGQAQGMFFSLRPGDAARVSATDSACWRWSAAQGALELALDAGRMQFIRRDRELLRRDDGDDALRTTRVYDRVANPSAGVASCTAHDGLAELFSEAPQMQRITFIATSTDGLRAVVLGRDGSAQLVEISLRDTKLGWSAARGCWMEAQGKLRIDKGAGSIQDYVVDGAGLMEARAGASERYVRAR